MAVLEIEVEEGVPPVLVEMEQSSLLVVLDLVEAIGLLV